VTLRVQGQSLGGPELTVLNFSSGGVLVRSTGPLQVEQTHELRFMSQDPDPAALVFEARVAHVTRSASERQAEFIAGLQFLDPRTGRQRVALRRLADLCSSPVRQPRLFI
jgi:c-di-GMP-binding flagellar brake protein YcgR